MNVKFGVVTRSTAPCEISPTLDSTSLGLGGHKKPRRTFKNQNTSVCHWANLAVGIGNYIPRLIAVRCVAPHALHGTASGVNEL